MTSANGKSRRDEVLVIGHVCRDLVDGTERIGGAAAYAARAAVVLGRHCTLVTAAPCHPLLAPLEEDSRITFVRKDCDEFTTFRLDYANGERQLFLEARALDLDPEDIPALARRIPVAYVAPVAGECSWAMVESLECECLILGAQGWMRHMLSDGRVVPRLRCKGLPLPTGVDIVVFSELDCASPESVAKELSSAGAVVVAVTRGAQGVTVFQEGLKADFPAPQVSREVDPTGAGDVFGISFGLAVHAGCPVPEAVRFAMQAAAYVVEGPELGGLPQRGAELRQQLIRYSRSPTAPERSPSQVMSESSA